MRMHKPLFLVLLTLLTFSGVGDVWAQSALESLDRGYIDVARAASTRSDDAVALTARARLAIRDADFEKAIELASLATRKATTDEIRSRAGVTTALARRAKGELEEAEATLREVLKSDTDAHEARLELGRILIETGRRDEGVVLLDPLATFYKNGLLKSSHELVILGEAMRLLGGFQDANLAFHKAIEKDPEHVRALVEMADLFLEKYNVADASRTFEDAAKKAPNNPDALVGLARVELQASNDFNKMRNILERASMLEPDHPGLHLTFAEIAVGDADCETAREHANTILENRPRELRALTFLAVCAYLDDDAKSYRASKKAVLDINPQYVDVLTETSRFAERVHRYDEAVELNRQALKIRPGYSTALLQLGIGLSRIGKEDEAIDVLRQAYDSDPYNVRAFNMLELYEKVMPEYEFVEHDRFKVRAHGSEHRAVDALVGPVVASSMQEFDQKYGFEPADYLAIEVYPSPSAFGVRSVGLPHIAPHGICFGKVVVSRSPSEGNFNWHSVIWHEMAHVYHIQLSDGRVPRWFTEGLAEYETNVKNPAWSRYHDRELYRALAADNLRGVMDLSKGFTHARNLEEVLRAYHQSSLVIHYLAQTHGFEKVVAMLREWGKRKTDAEVYKAVIGMTPDQIDDGFKKWLEKKYANFSGQLAVDLASVGSAIEAVKEAEAKRGEEGEALAWARAAVARIRDGDAQDALVLIEKAVKLAPKDPEVQHVAMLLSFEQGRMRDAHAHGTRVLEAARDSYSLRVMLGTAAQQLEKPVEATVHFRAATQLWKNGVEAWSALRVLAEAQGDDGLEELATRRVFELDQSSPVIARHYGKLMLEKKKYREALRAGTRWVDVAPFDGRSHEMIARAQLALENEDGAREAWQLWANVRPNDAQDVWISAIGMAREAKREGLAKELAEKARNAGASRRAIRRAMGEK